MNSSMATYPTIKYIEPLPGYRLFVIFDNGAIKVYSMKERLETPAFQALKDEALFYQAKVSSGGYGVIWSDEIDLSEYELWTNGVEVSSVDELAVKAGA